MPGDQPAVRVEDQRRVVHGSRPPRLGHAARQEEAVTPRRLGQARRARPVPRLGVTPRVLGQRLGVVAARPQLGQHEQLDAARGRPLDHAQRHRKILLWARPAWTAIAPRRPAGLASHPHRVRVDSSRRRHLHLRSARFGERFPVVNGLLQRRQPERRRTPSAHGAPSAMMVSELVEHVRGGDRRDLRVVVGRRHLDDVAADDSERAPGLAPWPRARGWSARRPRASPSPARAPDRGRRCPPRRRAVRRPRARGARL